MSIYSRAESGTKVYRSRFKLKDRRFGDINYGRIYPIWSKFVLPGDIWKISTDFFLRFQPMLAPSLTPNSARLRLFFVPLRLVEPNTELIITGSKDGHYDASVTIPDMEGLFDRVTVAANFVSDNDSDNVYNILFQLPPGIDYSTIKNEKSIPAAYWVKGYSRVFWDYYRDENLSGASASDFDALVDNVLKQGTKFKAYSPMLRKDYFTSSLPWQLKGIAPRISATGAVTFTGQFFTAPGPGSSNNPVYMTNGSLGQTPLAIANASSGDLSNVNDEFRARLGQNSLSSFGFDAAEFRAMMAETRIFERLARTGSRYTEYLRANFSTSPADGTLQRAQFIGGCRIPIVTTEVVQTAADGSNPVGTLRGHGISHSGDTFPTFHAQEFGMLFLMLDVMPTVQYTQGIDREFTYKRRFDFFNPSFQHLSEQEVRNGEIYIATDGLDDNTFGFQAYANELRSSSQKAFGEMRGNLAYWNQAIQFAARPNLNAAFVSSVAHAASFARPFAVTSGVKPMIVDLGVYGQCWRPMVKYGTPGLVDHL